MGDWFQGNGDGRCVDVVALFDSEAARLLCECVQLGALVSLSTTSDGGALGVTVTVDGRWRREYFRETEPLTEWFQGAQAAVAEAMTARGPSGERSRSRNPARRS
jgi:hypothetical protein